MSGERSDFCLNFRKQKAGWTEVRIIIMKISARRVKMAEKLSDGALSTVEPMEDEQKWELGELQDILQLTKQKREENKEDCKRMSSQAKEVPEKKVETLYGAFYGMLVQDCVDNILKKEVAHLATDMFRFRNKISKTMPEDESLDDKKSIVDVTKLDDVCRGVEGMETGI